MRSKFDGYLTLLFCYSRMSVYEFKSLHPFAITSPFIFSPIFTTSRKRPAMAENVAKQIMLSQGTTRPEIVKLLSSLNINLDLQLSKTDTANLLACLLTANQKQLQAIYDNDKTPLAIKIVVKRLMNDSKIGEIQTVEKLWDRIFGKTGMMLDLPQESKAAGIIPNTPVSREAYILIRESLLK